MDAVFYTLLQKRIASTAVGASTARGMGPKGTIQSARRFLANVDLARFSVDSEKLFSEKLDRVTAGLRRSLPRGARHWGAARKFLNIFLRGVVYNRHLYQRYKLSGIEPWLELPLDSHVAKGLRAEPNGRRIPRWNSVIRLDRPTSRIYQAFAAEVAREYGLFRVHLDLYYWRRESQVTTR